MSDQPILVTGATGLIGRRVAAILRSRQTPVRMLVRDPARLHLPEPPQPAAPPPEMVVGDLTDESLVNRAVEGCSSVIHMAALVHHSPNYQDYWENNVGATRHLISAIARCSLTMVHTSSLIVFSPPPVGELGDEGTSLAQPGTYGPYQATKAVNEQDFNLAIAEGADIRMVYPSSVYCSDVDTSSNIVRRFALRMLRDEAVWMPAPPSWLINIAWADDVAEGIVAALTQGKPGGRYILGGHNVTVKELAQELALLTGYRRSIHTLPAGLLSALAPPLEWVGRIGGNRRPLLARHTVRTISRSWAFSSERAIKELGYRVTALDTALGHLVEGLKKSMGQRGYGDYNGPRNV